MKTLAIIGASAGVGLLTAKQALANGHKVVTLSRNRPALPDNPNLTLISGSATNLDDTLKAIRGADAIIVALGTGLKITWKQFTKGTTLYTDATRVLLQATKQTGTKVPLIVLTGFGAGESKQYQPFLIRTFMGALLGRIYQNKTAMEELITAGYQNYILVRPGMLTDKPATGDYKAQTTLAKGMSVPAIPRADVAAYIVSQAENPTDRHHFVALVK